MKAKCKGEEFLKHYGSATVGERGQVVLPAEARKWFSIKAGERLLVFGSDAGGFERLVLMKSDAVTGILKHLFNVEKTLKKSPAELEKMAKEGMEKAKRVKKELKRLKTK